MMYELASTRPKIWNLLFMLFFSLLMSYFILSAPYFDLFMAFFALGDVLVIFTLCYSAYYYLSGKTPTTLETIGDAIKVTYYNHETEIIPYHKIRGAMVLPYPSRLETRKSWIVTFAYGKRKYGRFRLWNRQDAEAIAAGIQGKND